MFYILNGVPSVQIENFFTIEKAAKLANLTETMVDYLCRTEIVIPTANRERRHGIVRRYAFKDVIVLRAVAQLLKQGVKVSKLKDAIKKLRRRKDIDQNSVPERYLITDGKNIFFKKQDEVIEDIKTGQLVFSFVIDLDLIRQQVLTEISSKMASRSPQ
jgi:DNA-binding transcriptional MerR regulator